MSLIFTEGFDNVDDNTELLRKGWSTASGTFDTTNPRTGPRAYGTGGFLNLGRQVPAAAEHATFIAGFSMYHPTSLKTSVNFYLSSDALGTDHVRLSVSSTGQILVNRGSGANLLASSDPGVIVVDTQYYIEIKALLSDTVGTVEVKVNGATVCSATNIDTKNGGTKTVFDSMRWQHSSGSAYNIDDIYLANGAGAINNTFIGECRVRTLYPNGNGNSNQLVGSDGNSVDNYALVDDITPGTGDFVGSSVAAAKDTYGFEDLPDVTGTVVGVTVYAYGAKTDTALRSLLPVTRTSGNDYDGAEQALSTDPLFAKQLQEVNPATAVPWLRSEVNAAEFGVKIGPVP
jgi:hypothetical protein